MLSEKGRGRKGGGERERQRTEEGERENGGLSLPMGEREWGTLPPPLGGMFVNQFVMVRAALTTLWCNFSEASSSYLNACDDVTLCMMM